LFFYFFFFSSRRRHTRCLSDWSSDVCSSDLHIIDISAFCPGGPCGEVLKQEIAPLFGARVTAWVRERLALDLSFTYSRTGVMRRSEERRVGKECRGGGGR